MAKIVKGVIDEKGNLITFMNDRDGFSAKDFLMMVTIGLFSLSFIVALILILIGKELDQGFFSLMETSKPIFITVIAGVMGIQCTEAITSTINKKYSDSQNQDQDGPIG